MRAIAEACAQGRLNARVGVVVSSNPQSPALSAARELNLATEAVPGGDFQATKLLNALQGCDLVCLAGYMRLIPKEVLEAFPDRTLNIHPSLLPKFGGKGMYGNKVHQAVLDAGETETGCTVHLVNDRYDEGRILTQEVCSVLPGDTAEILADRVLDLEHRAYSRAIGELILGLRI